MAPRCTWLTSGPDRGGPGASATGVRRWRVLAPEPSRAGRSGVGARASLRAHRRVAGGARRPAGGVVRGAARARAPREIWLDPDPTDDPLHGTQEGGFLHGYYRYCCLPLYICCGEHLLCRRLRSADRDQAAGPIEELQRISTPGGASLTRRKGLTARPVREAVLRARGRAGRQRGTAGESVTES